MNSRLAGTWSNVELGSSRGFSMRSFASDHRPGWLITDMRLRHVGGLNFLFEYPAPPRPMPSRRFMPCAPMFACESCSCGWVGGLVGAIVSL
jgi:hypothetical protein